MLKVLPIIFHLEQTIVKFLKQEGASSLQFGSDKSSFTG